MILRTFLIHNHVTACPLLATLVPIIKDKLGNRCSRKNYRSIAISSLVLKILDWVIIILFGVNLQLDQNQFAYQSGCSTTMCTWAALETIDFFLINNSLSLFVLWTWPKILILLSTCCCSRSWWELDVLWSSSGCSSSFIHFSQQMWDGMVMECSQT